MSQTNLEDTSGHKDIGNYFNQAELERYTAMGGLLELAEMLSNSKDKNNLLMGSHLLSMADNILKTLPNLNGGVQLDVELTNRDVKDEQLDDIINDFFK